ncbi:PLP-dependent cysteine synthase family protein [Xanthovirga aplysinae]|uniref:PLP-dependent cysteine synthase family protein n=1 Tax=Xanthovirga aplysinae TaxID=2529853 RepID=UPI0012BBE72A|nr:cysteine synthase family protein [Xanthovirga aplysinae]MTI29847.1 cysteine synthase family protein [Xanthovirga aplysinae]
MIIEPIDKKLMLRLQAVGRQIGNTPLVPLNKIFQKKEVSIYAKWEWMQLGGSVKARPAFNIMYQAAQEGLLNGRKHLLDASSGNTAIAYAAIGAQANIPVTICLPENASKERKAILKALGAELIYTSQFGSTDEAQLKALELKNEQPEKYFYADQYANDNNWKAHFENTGPEIWRQSMGEVTHFVAGLGTTGTFTGTGRRLKELRKETQLISLQPDSPMHGLEGWKHMETAIVPKIFDAQLADQNLDISTNEAYDCLKMTARKEGIILSPSSAANLAGAIRLAETLEKGVLVTVFPDNGDKYSEALEIISGT